MTVRNTTIKPLFLMLFFCANASYAVEKGEYIGKFTPQEVFRLETYSNGPTKECRYRPVVDGVSMGWFEGVFLGNARNYTCRTKNHGEIGELHTFNDYLWVLRDPIEKN